MYLLRLDDASEYRDVEKWYRMEELLEKYNIKPIFGIIPDCKDPSLLTYSKDNFFWCTVAKWIDNGWIPAMHGYQHLFKTHMGGVNPVNHYSEFAGVSYEEQCEQIQRGYNILKSHQIDTKIFFAPAHTYDNNTLKALEKETSIRIICDTIANDIYYKGGFYYIPQQAGAARELPFRTTTFCYHPNTMRENDFDKLECFLNNHKSKFINFSSIRFSKRRKSFFDMVLQILYRYRTVVKRINL